MLDINGMTRPNVIRELQKYVHTDKFDEVLKWETKELKELLTYYINL